MIIRIGRGTTQAEAKKARQRSLAWALYATCVALTLAALLLEVLNRSGARSGIFIFPNAAVQAVFFPLVGLIIARRQPGNAIGWIFYIMGLSEALSLLAAAYAVYALVSLPGSLPGGAIMTWVAYSSWVPGFLLIPALLLLFPTGRPPSPRWQWVCWLVGAAVLVNTVNAAWPSWALRGLPLLHLLQTGADLNLRNGPAERALSDVSSALLAASFGLSILAMVLRLRRSRGVERQQLKWFSYAAVLAAIIEMAVVAVFSTGLITRDPLLSAGVIALQALALVGIAVAVGVAIARYRLFDIDVVINRTLVYGALTVVLALVYVSSILLFQALLSPLAAGSEAATVASTLLTAALFNPLRRRLQAVIDRRFYRRKYDARLTLAAYGARLRADTDLESVAADLLNVVDDTLQPEHVSLWLQQATPVFHERPRG